MSLFLYFFRVTTHRVICSNLQALPGGVRSWPVLKSTVAQSNFCGREPILHSSIVVGGRSQEDRQMWFYVQTWLPLLSISLTAAICFGVASSLWDRQNLVLTLTPF